MRFYNVYTHTIRRPESVKHGWSWPGFFFTFIWAFVKQMWAIGLGLLAIELFIICAIDDPGIGTIINIASWVVFGWKGNSWRESNLISRGYSLAGTTAARNCDDALARVLTTENSF